ncbi:hypothetical protein BJX65DRAFT_310497 [Aspergillus insuetus]
MASLAHLSKDLPTFEIAEIQAMAFLQINSLLVTFFCMVAVQCFAALFIWAPIPVELLFILNDFAQDKSEKWRRWNKWITVHFTPRSVEEINEHTPLAQNAEHGPLATPDRIEDDHELLLVAVPSQNTAAEDTATSSGRSAVLPS